jgi:hypothetical protein
MRRIALVGAAVAVLVAGIVLLGLIVRLAGDDRVDVTDLELGACFSLDDAVDDDGTVTLVEPFDCDESHDAQVVLVGDLNPNADRSYPPDDELFAEVDARCATVTPDPRFGLVPIAPTEATWNGRDGRFVCVALVIGGGEVTGDHASLAERA